MKVKISLSRERRKGELRTRILQINIDARWAVSFLLHPRNVAEGTAMGRKRIRHNTQMLSQDGGELQQISS